MCLVYLIFSFRACLHWEDYLFFLSILSTDDCSLESMFKNHWAESETHFRQTVVWAGDGGGNSVAECEPTIYKALDSTLNATRKAKKKLFPCSDLPFTSQRRAQSYSTKPGNASFFPLFPGTCLKFVNYPGSHRNRTGSPSVCYGKSQTRLGLSSGPGI